MTDEYDDLFELLPTAAQQLIARGETTIAEYVDRITAPNADDLCPACCARPITHVPLGLCRACAKRRFAEAHRERADELEAQAAFNLAKKVLQRTRDALEPDRARAPAPFRQCEACGVRLPRKRLHPGSRCVDCTERLERRDAAREAQSR